LRYDHALRAQLCVSFGLVRWGVGRRLTRRRYGARLPAYDAVPAEAPFARTSGTRFEEKLVAPQDTFATLCREHLAVEETETLCG
jgi:hypothetical protein